MVKAVTCVSEAVTYVLLKLGSSAAEAGSIGRSLFNPKNFPFPESFSETCEGAGGGSKSGQGNAEKSEAADEKFNSGCEVTPEDSTTARWRSSLLDEGGIPS